MSEDIKNEDNYDPNIDDDFDASLFPETIFGIGNEDWAEMREQLTRELNEQLEEAEKHDARYNRDGFEFDTDDDIFYELLCEDLTVKQFSDIQPGDVVYVKTIFQDNDGAKIRPMVVIDKSGTAENPQFKGFPITTKAPDPDKYRTGFRVALIDGFRKVKGRSSLYRNVDYINYDHSVISKVDGNPSVVNVKLSYRDFRKLLAAIQADYDDLIRCGYNTKEEKTWLDHAIEILKTDLTRR